MGRPGGIRILGRPRRGWRKILIYIFKIQNGGLGLD
jgi:hypothetical protein